MQIRSIRLSVSCLAAIVAVVLLGSTAPGQRKSAPAKVARHAVFAILNDGKTLEPIAYVENKRLKAAISGSDDPKLLNAFVRAHYKSGTVYRLIFGGADSGTVKVKSNDPKADCSRTLATAETVSSKTALKGLVMGLATNAPQPIRASFRRRPTPTEREEVEALVKAEFSRQKITNKTLRFHNLTALDLEGDGRYEMVGSYWVEIDKDTRGLLYFIAGIGSNGKYSIGFKDYRTVDKANVMSGEISSIDQGVYHELLLDVFDVDGDGTAEIFTYTQGFEGAGFAAYRRAADKWSRMFEGSNYHCGF
jgi:hypothetical protein